MTILWLFSTLLEGKPLHKWEKGTESVVLSPSKHNRRSPFDKLRATYLSYATVSLEGKGPVKGNRQFFAVAWKTGEPCTRFRYAVAGQARD